MGADILVVGSLNIDLVVHVDEFPKGGETVAGWGFRTDNGGKGGNQACAAALLGGTVRMIGRVGDDVFGDRLIAGLRRAGVDAGGVTSVKAAATGVAVIAVDSAGQNQIIVSAGANASFTAGEVASEIETSPARYLLLQLESPMEAVVEVARSARRRGLCVILDPAPARRLARTLLSLVDILTPNESEAMTLLGLHGGEIGARDAASIARSLRDLGVGTVILKLGSRGAIVATVDGVTHHPAPIVPVVDTTAAGDTFNGALAVALAEGKDLHRAIQYANVAAALSVSRHGAQSSMPNRLEVEEWGPTLSGHPGRC